MKDAQQQINLNDSVLPWVGKTSKMMSILFKERFEEYQVDLTKEQFILLKVLHEEDGIPQKDLAYITERNKSSLARLINTMERKKFVARIPSEEDKRINRIFLTVHGKKIFEQLQPVVFQNIQLAQKGLSPAEIKTAIAILAKIQQNIEAILK